ncbi:hypothetical protein [Streptomyces albogriseolus]|uniref:hypothetical protein n=1 Tax=Streptomyces albogriseolus TaxID=1887 RepID=UPI003D733217
MADRLTEAGDVAKVEVVVLEGGGRARLHTGPHLMGQSGPAGRERLDLRAQVSRDDGLADGLARQVLPDAHRRHDDALLPGLPGLAAALRCCKRLISHTT